MEGRITESSTLNTEIFDIVTQFYVRLRRVTGRVVDVLYMVENREYARHLIKFALTVDDAELQRHVSQLNELINPEPESARETESNVTPPEATEKVKSNKHLGQATWFLG